MGFSYIWELVEGNFEQIQLIQSNELWKDKRTCLLIDYNNISINYSCGNLFLDAKFNRVFWTAILNSGFRVRIIKDSFDHNSLRSNTKLKRYLNGCHSQNDLQANSTVGKVVDAKEFINKFVRDNVGIDAQIIRCEGEADSAIRRLCRENQAAKQNTIIISDDASLLIGIPASAFVAKPSLLVLRTNESSGEVRLAGPILQVSTYLELMNRNIRRLSLTTSLRLPEVDAPSLCLVAALLDGEQERDSLDEDEQPYKIVRFVGSYLFGEGEVVGGISVQHPLQTGRRHRSLTKMGALLSAAILVQAWLGNSALHHAGPNLEDPLSLFSENILLECVRTTLHAAYSRTGSVFGLPRAANFQFRTVQQLDSAKIVKLLRLRMMDSLDVTEESSVLYGCSRAIALKSAATLPPSDPRCIAAAEGKVDLMFAPFNSLTLQISKLIWKAPAEGSDRGHSLESFSSALQALRQPGQTDRWLELCGDSRTFNSWMGDSGDEHSDSGSDSDEDDLDRTQVRKLHWRAYAFNPTTWPTSVLEHFPLFTAHSLAEASSRAGHQLPCRGRLEKSRTEGLLWRVKATWRRHGDVACSPVYPWLSVGTTAEWNPLLIIHQRAALIDCLRMHSHRKSSSNVEFVLALFRALLPAPSDSVLSVVPSVKEWWRRAMDLGNFNPTSVDHFAGNMDSFVVTILLSVQVLLSLLRVDGGFLGLRDANEHQRFLQKLVPRLLEACLLSPLFALAGERVISSFENIAVTTQQTSGKKACAETVSSKFKQWTDGLNEKMRRASGSLGQTPVGRPEDYLLVEALDRILKCLLRLCRSKHFCAWFDSHGVCLSLRMHEMKSDVLGCRAVWSELFPPQPDAISALRTSLFDGVLPSLVPLIAVPPSQPFDANRFFDWLLDEENMQSDVEPSVTNTLRVDENETLPVPPVTEGRTEEAEGLQSLRIPPAAAEAESWEDARWTPLSGQQPMQAQHKN